MRIFLGVGIVAALIVGYIGFLWISHIDNRVKAGSAYGFEIGSSKEEVVATLKKIYGNKKISLEYIPRGRDKSQYQQLDFERDLEKFYNKDHWKFYLGYRSKIEFRFYRGRLEEIRRWRQYYEGI